MFCCNHCQRSYQRKLYFDRHVIACQYLAKSKRERTLECEETTDTPSVRDLYAIILTLAAKCNELETKMQEISKWAHITKQKLNITDWLNTVYPSAMAYAEWFATLRVTPADLTVLFDSDYVGGVTSLLKKQLPITDDSITIRAFTSKENTFYIFQEKWVLCDNETFTKLMQFYDNAFMGEFIRWQTANKSRMATDDSFSELYARNMKKIMGGNFTREQLYSRIKKELYMHLRSEPPNILEYETHF
jgi:hypothetical protein